MGFAKKSASNRSCRNAPTRTTPRGKRSFGRYAREAGQPLRGDRRARRRRRRSPSGNAVVLCATIRMKKPSAKDLRRFSFRSCACDAFAVSSRNRDLTSLRSFYLFCLPQGRYRKCESRYATNGPKRKNRFQATLKRFSLSFLRLRRFRSFEPKPRFNFATLVLSLLLAAGALSKMRKSLCDKRTETKKPLSSYLEAVFPFVPAPAALSQFRAETEI